MSPPTRENPGEAETSGARITVIGALPPYRGGISHFTTTTTLGLRDRGHDVQALTFSRQYPSLLFPGKSQFREDGADPVGAIRSIDTLHPWSWWRSGSRVREHGSEAVLFNHWMPFFAPAYGSIARRVGPAARRICLCHNALPHEPRPADALLSRWFFRACDGFLTLSDEVTRDLRTLGVEAPIRQLVHPVYDIFGEAVPREVAREHLGLDPTRPTALFFGYIRPYKGLDDLIEAFARARHQRPDLQLLVVGEFYEGEERIRERIRELGLENDLRLVGEYVPDSQVRDWFSASDVVVQPYRTASQSGVAQIAFQFERPMILTDVGGLAEVVPHEVAGLVVPPRDPEALARALVRFFDEDWAPRLRTGVREGKRRFSWDRLYEAFEEIARLEDGTS